MQFASLLQRNYSHIRQRRATQFGVVLLAGSLALAGCSNTTDHQNDSGDSGDSTPIELTLVTHDSFVVPQELFDEFEADTGITVNLLASGDAGSLVNQLVLTKDSPLGDVVFGIDNNLAGRAIESEILVEYVSEDLTEAEEKFLLPGRGQSFFTPITSGDVCLNIDPSWFESHNLLEPKTLEDLVSPDYRGLFVTPGASTSSPGLAFLLATIDAFGEDGWQEYWQKLVDNEVLITAGWSDAYNVDFTASGGDGSRPIVLSYGSSPAFAPETVSLNETCYRQVEYAGILVGTKHEEAAKQLVDFLFSVEVQESIPENMWVFPTNQQAQLPEEWEENVSIPEDAFFLDPEVVEQNREDWVMTWSQIATP